MLRNRTLWDDPAIATKLLSSDKSAHQYLLKRIKDLHGKLEENNVLERELCRKVLILSLLIAYLEARGILNEEDFGIHLPEAKHFFQVLENGPALVSLLKALQERFNGNVFVLKESETQELHDSNHLKDFARIIEAREEESGQRSLWELYSFGDIPVELISHIYQHFVKNKNSSVYTPPFLVRLMLYEAMSHKRLDWLEEQNAIVLDPACGSGVFLVEAYKRLVVHWRKKNNWKSPDTTTLKKLLRRVQGIDLDEGAVELASFSLCLALCDSLPTAIIRRSKKLFSVIRGKTIHQSCFFETLEKQTIKDKIGILVGNPPFESKMTTNGAQKAYDCYQEEHGRLPDKQLAYLFLHEGMKAVTPKGILCLLQKDNFLYNQKSEAFRKNFISSWEICEILDFISIWGLFKGGEAKQRQW